MSEENRSKYDYRKKTQNKGRSINKMRDKKNNQKSYFNEDVANELPEGAYVNLKEKPKETIKESISDDQVSVSKEDPKDPNLEDPEDPEDPEDEYEKFDPSYFDQEIAK